MNKPVSLNRASRILECYGSQPEAWPRDERASTWHLVESSSDMQAQQDEAAAIDEILAADRALYDKSVEKVDFDSLNSRIMESLPGQEDPVDAPTAKKHKPWGYSLAASFVISAIATLLYLSQPHYPANNNADANAFDQWAWNQFFTEDTTRDQDNSILASAFPAISMAEPSLLE